MKQCPNCHTNISDTAKFCVKCGFNVKKYEEEQAQEHFCPECGTKFSGGMFCPECGFNISTELSAQPASPETDTFGDGWLSALESRSNDEVTNMKAQEAKELVEKALAAFDYEAHADGTYTVVALKDKHALNITVPAGVIAIADHAFEGCEAFAITLPDGLLKIGNASFKGATDLANINLPQSLLSIGDEAFAACMALDIEIPASVRKVGQNAMFDTIPDKKRKAELAKYQVGNIITFGSYKKAIRWNGTKCFYEDDATPIEWIVLRQEDEKALVLSKRVLEFKKFHESKTNVTWETSTLRSWLNDDFFNTAFSSAEQAKIESRNVPADKYEYGSFPGKPTVDKIFLLSFRELSEHFKEEAVYGTQWWLRTPRSELYFLIGTNDSICTNYANKSPDYRSVDTRLGVRPAMWIDILK